MRPEEFEQELGRLRLSFGIKAFDSQRSERIYKFCRHLTEEEFRRVVDVFVDTSRLAPLPKDFYDVARNIGKPYQSAQPKKFSMMLRCGHEITYSEFDRWKGACTQCLKDGYWPEIIKYPYLLEFIPRELHEEARFFQRQGDRTLLDYSARVYPRMSEIESMYGLKPKDKKSNIIQEVQDILFNVISGSNGKFSSSAP